MAQMVAAHGLHHFWFRTSENRCESCLSLTNISEVRYKDIESNMPKNGLYEFSNSMNYVCT